MITFVFSVLSKAKAQTALETCGVEVYSYYFYYIIDSVQLSN